MKFVVNSDMIEVIARAIVGGSTRVNKRGDYLLTFKDEYGRYRQLVFKKLGVEKGDG